MITTSQVAQWEIDIKYFRDQLESLRAERDTLRAEQDALKEDAGRLDWLQEWDGQFNNIDRITAVRSVFNGCGSLRDAIDRARKGTT